MTHTIYQSVGQVPDADWLALTGDDPDITWDRRLITAFETTMADRCRCFTIVVRDRSGAAAAVACTWLHRVDLGNFAWTARAVRWGRKVWPNFMQLGVLFCGLPLPSGQNHLRIVGGVDREAAVEELERAFRIIAKENHARMVVIMEFDDGQCQELAALPRLGYLRGEIPPRHRMDRPFTSFDEYVNSLKARYRSQVNRSLKKLQTAGFRVEQARGTQMAEIYTDQVHELYEAVLGRSEYKLEHYTAEFIRELARRFGDDASLTCIYRADRIAAHTIGLARGPIYHNLYSGLDYSLKGEGDLYFNLFYWDLDFAWRRGAQEVHLGQTSDDFKARLGSKIEPLYLFIRPTGAIIRWGMKTFRKWALPAIKPVEEHDVFNSATRRTKEGSVSV